MKVCWDQGSCLIVPPVRTHKIAILISISLCCMRLVKNGIKIAGQAMCYTDTFPTLLASYVIFFFDKMMRGKRPASRYLLYYIDYDV